MRFIERSKWFLHILGWLLFISSPILLVPPNNSRIIIDYRFLLFLFTENLPIVIFFYINLYWLTPTFLVDKKLLKFVLIIVLLFVVSFTISITLFRFSFPIPTPMPPPAISKMPMMILPGLIRYFLTFTFAGLVSSVLVLVQDRVKTREMQQKILFEKTNAELEVLKLQISPHFLFNTLNNIRWLARQKSDKTEDAVVKLSTLLRYILYQAKESKVELSQEIKHLEDFITLQRMRLTDRTIVEFVCQGETDKYLIEPLLFIPFVENAFKYGVHSQLRSNIAISINVTDDLLVFMVKNAVFDKKNTIEVESSGIGIANVEKRLKLIYPETYDLKITEDDKFYEVKLMIKLANE